MDKASETLKTERPEDASDAQLEEVAGGQRRYRDENGNYREGEHGAYHYHDGYRGKWNGGIFIQL